MYNYGYPSSYNKTYTNTAARTLAFVSGTVGPGANPDDIVLIFNKAVTWSGADPRGLAVIGGSGTGTIPGIDWTLTYVSGKGTNTLVFTGDGQIGSGEVVGLTYNIDDTGNITDLSGNALADITYPPTTLTNNIPDLTAPDAGAQIFSNGTTFRLNLTEACTGGTSGNAGITLSASGGAVTVTYASSGSAQNRDFTLSRTIGQGETVTFSYSPGNIQDLAGNALPVLTNYPVSNASTVDLTAPTVTSKEVQSSGTQVRLQFSETVVNYAVNGIFSVHVGGETITTTWAAGPSGGWYYYHLSRILLQGETATLTYTPGTIEDSAGNDLAAFSGSAITNNSTEVVPTVTAKTINTAGTELTITFSETITGGTSGAAGFTLSASGGAVTVTYLSSGSNSRVYTLSRIIEQGETVTLSYTPGNIEDSAGNDLAAFSGSAITNNSTVPPPPFPVPVAYWKLDNNLNDSSGNGNTLVEQSGFNPIGFQASAKFAEGLSQGIGVYAAQIVLAEGIGSGSYSVSFWIRDPDGTFLPSIAIRNSSFMGLDLGITHPFPAFTPAITGGLTGTSFSFADLGNYSPVTANTWYNVILVVSGNQAKTYVNGTLINTSNTAGVSGSYDNGFDILVGLSDPAASAVLDEVAVFDAPLTIGDITAIAAGTQTVAQLAGI